jgi:hypothetical protein
VLLAVLIGFASVFSAVLAWRASLASIDSSRFQSLAVQDAARRNQLERLLEGTVGQDERFVVVFQEHSRAARELGTQATALRETDPESADILDLEAQAHAALARAMQPFFLGAGGIQLGDGGTVGYDREFVLASLRDADIELGELSTQRSVEQAQRADARSLSLIGIEALIIAALFFLTVAQVSRSQWRVRQVFFAIGGVLVAVGTLGFVAVEVLA